MLYKLEKDNKLEKLSDADIHNVLGEIERVLDYYKYDHYRFYPSKNQKGWKQLFVESLKRDLKKDDFIFIYANEKDIPVISGFRINTWDEEVFGFKTATSAYTFFPNGFHTRRIQNIIYTQLEQLEDRGVKSITFRCNGDQLPLIHAVNELKFQYYETIIWPVSQIGDVKINDEVKVRLINDSEFEVAAEIARKYQYDRGHFYCDSKYKKEAVDNLYAKWVLSSKNNGASVAIAEYKDKVAGYFVFKMDDLLKKHLGYSYGRLSLLALDGAFRGHGIGKALFSGTMNLIKNMGGEYIDSGYATKNHISAKLHTMNSFYSVYEELTFHHWL